MVDILFRTDGVWGAGKGSRLNKVEVDENFWSLKQAVEALQSTPLQPLQIADIQVTGNQMTIVLSDNVTTFGPFTLPTAVLRWRDIWEANTPYLKFDLFTALEGMYLVLQDHTSDPTFDPSATNVNGALYRLVFPYPNLYSFGFYWPGFPGASIEDGRAMFAHAFTRSVILPVDLAGSIALLEDAPVAPLSFVIEKDGVSVGTINFAEYESIGTFTFADQVQFDPGDRIKVLKPAAIDPVAMDLTVTFNGTLGSLS